MAISTLSKRPTLLRYTDLAVAFHILQTKSLTLVDPERWDDGNDRFGMAEYKSRLGLQGLFAMCFAECPETYHHWKVFSPGMSGVYIEFFKDPLVAHFDQIAGVAYRSVEYRTMNLLKPQKWKVADLPFTKRAPYKPEKEFRAIYESDMENIDHFDIEIEMPWIKRVVLSPWLPKVIRPSVTKALRSIDGCKRLTVQGTALIDSDTWKSRVTRASD